jgi:UMF1 family MFS transporter
MEELERVPKRQILSWTLFDFANTAFYVVVLTVGYPLYFNDVVVGHAGRGEALWGSAFSISMFIVAFFSPLLGAAVDHGGGKKRLLFLFTALCIIATAALFFVRESMIVQGMIFLVVANIGFEGGLVFYDAFLPEIASTENYGRISGYGFAMGYAGSLATLLVTMPLYVGGFGAENLINIRLSFIIAAALFLLFSLPLFLFLPERVKSIHLGWWIAKVGFTRVYSTFKEIKKFKNVARFLLSYFIYIDAVNTIIIFASIFARKTLNMELLEIIIFFLIVQTSAIFGSLLFGFISDKIGHKRALEISLVLWVGIVIASYIVTQKVVFFGIGVFAGIALGSSQSSSRSLMTSLLPPEKRTEGFGFYSFFGKASAIIGPFVFGIVASYLNQRAAILCVGCFLVVGLLLLTRVKVPERQP